jgi:hypothetical protein
MAAETRPYDTEVFERRFLYRDAFPLSVPTPVRDDSGLDHRGGARVLQAKGLLFSRKASGTQVVLGV